MKKQIPLLLALCLLLAGCTRTQPEEAPSIPEVSPAPAESEKESRSLERLAVELVVDWEDTNRVLESQTELERLLREALAAQDWAVEMVQVTISTAGGPTGDALAAGGVDAACLPEADYSARAEDAIGLLTAQGVVFAVAGTREELDESFQTALAAALLETEPGAQFLSLYSPGRSYTALS